MISEQTQSHIINFLMMIFKTANAMTAKTGVEFSAEELAGASFIGNNTRKLLGSNVLSEILTNLIPAPRSSFQPIAPEPPAFPNSPEDVEFIHMRRPTYEDELIILKGSSLDEIAEQFNQKTAENLFCDFVGDLKQLEDGSFYWPVSCRRKVADPTESAEASDTQEDNPENLG